MSMEKNVCKILLASFFLFSQSDTFCQHREIPPSYIFKYRVTKYLLKEDSVVKEYNDPLIEVDKFFIRIQKASFNKASNEIHLNGKICFDNNFENCHGLPGVGIFKAQINKNNVLINLVELAMSTYDKDSIENSGFFDFQFKVNKDESLFFFMPNFYLEEFKLGEIRSKK